jgi:hypothetical protein
MGMDRLEGWEHRLDDLIQSARQRPYELGVHDCFSFTCEAIRLLTGRDNWPQFKGYTTKREAVAAIAQRGASMEEAGDWFFQSERLRPAMARRGDVLLLRTEDGEKHLGICMGVTTAFLHEKGVLLIPTLSCICCWRIG